MPRWLKLLLLALVVAGVGILSLPWWLGAALRPVLKARGVTFDRYERVGYAHFRLLGVRYQTLIGPVRVEYGHNLNPRPFDPDGTLLFSIGFPF